MHDDPLDGHDGLGPCRTDPPSPAEKAWMLLILAVVGVCMVVVYDDSPLAVVGAVLVGVGWGFAIREILDHRGGER